MMDDTESGEHDGQGGIIFHRGYLIQGEHQTVEGGLTLVFHKNGKRYAVLQNTGPLQFCLCLFKDEKTFMKRDRRNAKVTEMHFTANIKIHSLEMMMGRSRKPQNILIIVHGGMPRYFKPTNGGEMLEWVTGFQKVANAIARRPSLNPSPRSSSEDDSHVTSRSIKPKRPDQDSGIDITSRGSAMSTYQSEKGGGDDSSPQDDSLGNILPEVIEMDIPEEDGDDVASPGYNVDEDDGPCRRSRMVLNQEADRYEEQFVVATPGTIPRSTVQKSKSKFHAIEEEHEKPKPEPKPRTLKTVEEIRKNIVPMRLSAWPNRPESGEKDPAKDPNYQKVVVKMERRPSEPEGVSIDLDTVPKIPPKWNRSFGQLNTMDKVKDLEKQLKHNVRPYGPNPARSISEKIKKRAPSRPKRESGVIDQDDDEDGDGEVLTTSNEDPNVEPPYDRLSKFRQGMKGVAVEEEGQEKDDEEVIEEDEEVIGEDSSDKRSSGESLPDTDRKRLYTNPNQNRRPLPKPNQEMDWKDVGNMVYEQSCRSCNVTVAKSDIKSALVLVKLNNEVMIAGWKKELSDKLHGKLHVGDVILQVNDIIVDENSPEFVHALINASAKIEIPFVIKRLPYASIKELNKTAGQTSWGLETHKNEIKSVSGPALDGGITPKTSAVLSSKQSEWVVTELAHQLIPLLKCPQDEVKQRLENLSNETNLVLIIQPRDLITELREGIKRIKHPSDYYM